MPARHALNSPTMIHAIVFDFDGVIVDSEPIHYKAFLKVVEPFGIDFDYGVYVERYAGFDDREGLRAILSDHNVGLDEAKMAELIESKARALAHIVAEGIKPMPGAVELVRACAEVWPIAICSGALRSDIELMLPAVAEGLLDQFRVVVTAEDVARSKPDPASYRIAAERLACEAAGCVAIEDTPAGLASAADAGMRTLAVTHTYPRPQLDRADRVVDDLTEVGPAALRQWFGGG